MSWGTFAVGGFFALSGLLVTMSGRRRPMAGFIRSRMLRVLPAYLTVLIASAALLGPVIYFLTHGELIEYFKPSGQSPYMYIVRNAFFPMNMQTGIADVFEWTTPYGVMRRQSIINGSLWTLPMEVRCYVVALLVVVVGRRLGMTRTAVGALVLVAGVIALSYALPDGRFDPLPEYFPAAMMDLLFVFLCGAVVGTMADRIHVTLRLFAAAGAVFIAASMVGGVMFRLVGLGSLALLLPVVAGALPGLRGWDIRSDLSYGTYIWAFPTQQTLAFAGLNYWPVAYVLGSAGITLGLAALSWKFIERPALERK